MGYKNIWNGELGLNAVWNRVWGVSTLSDLMSQYPAEELLTASPGTDVIGRNMTDILKCNDRHTQMFVCMLTNISNVHENCSG